MKKTTSNTMLYKCELCNKIFDRKQAYQYHISRKNPCVSIQIDSKIFVNNLLSFSCKFCNKIFDKQYKLNRHYSKCEHILDDDADDDDDDDTETHIYAEQGNGNGNEELESSVLIKHPVVKLENNEYMCNLCNRSFGRRDNLLRHQKSCVGFTKKTKKIESKNGVVNNITNNVTINLFAFGKEDFSNIDFYQHRNLLTQDGVSFFVGLFNLLHLEYPQYKNIKITNFSKPAIQTYNGETWEYNTSLIEMNSLLEIICYKYMHIYDTVIQYDIRYTNNAMKKLKINYDNCELICQSNPDKEYNDRRLEQKEYFKTKTASVFKRLLYNRNKI